jgi:hypothetical protein
MRILLLGDSCSGIPGTAEEVRFRRLVEAVLPHAGSADCLCYLGDHIAGYTADQNELARQWEHFLGLEFAPLAAAFAPVFHLPSNHTVYDPASAAFFAGRVQDPMPAGRLLLREGLNFAAEVGEAALIFLCTADARRRGQATIDLPFLSRALGAAAGARWRIVLGHHPLWPVNGYARFPLWCVAPAEARQAWAMLCAAGVSAYACSHIIAYDLQIHDGVPQICTAGAGTVYGPGGAMPGAVEYPHFVVLDLEEGRMSWRVYDQLSTARDRFEWPMAPGDSVMSATLGATAVEIAAPAGWDRRPAAAFRLEWHIRAEAAGGIDRPLLYAWSEEEGPAILRLDLAAGRLVGQLVPVAGEGARRWLGPSLAGDQPLDLEVVLHGNAGPGGFMVRASGGAWSSMASDSARGAELMCWPRLWVAGRDPEAEGGQPGQEPPLEVAFRIDRLS